MKNDNIIDFYESFFFFFGDLMLKNDFIEEFITHKKYINLFLLMMMQN